MSIGVKNIAEAVRGMGKKAAPVAAAGRMAINANPRTAAAGAGAAGVAGGAALVGSSGGATPSPVDEVNSMLAELEAQDPELAGMFHDQVIGPMSQLAPEEQEAFARSFLDSIANSPEALGEIADF